MSLWLDSISRPLLAQGLLTRYIRDYAVSGLTSNPAIFRQAFESSSAYDEAILEKAAAGSSCETIFSELAIEDITRACASLRAIHDSSDGREGWVSLEVPPGLSQDAAGTSAAAAALHGRVALPNLLVKIPGTRVSLVAVEESVYRGIPVNITLLFSPRQYLAAAEAYMRGIERRLSDELDPKVASVASLFVSRWDTAFNPLIPETQRNRLGLAVALRTYRTHRELLASPRWRQLESMGALPQRLLWASTSSKDPLAPVSLYLSGLALPGTISTVAEATLLAYAAGDGMDLPPGGIETPDDVHTGATLETFHAHGLDLENLAEGLQQEGLRAFSEAWQELMALIRLKSKRKVQAAHD